MEITTSLFFQSCWLDSSVWILYLRMKHQQKSQKKSGEAHEETPVYHNRDSPAFILIKSSQGTQCRDF